MAASGWIMIERMGTSKVLGVAALILAFRLCFYALVAMSHTNDLKGPTDEGACTSGISPWFVLPVELLHGFGFGVAWIATCGAPIT